MVQDVSNVFRKRMGQEEDLPPGSVAVVDKQGLSSAGNETSQFHQRAP
jgi:hypothetical protein